MVTVSTDAELKAALAAAKDDERPVLNLSNNRDVAVTDCLITSADPN